MVGNGRVRGCARVSAVEDLGEEDEDGEADVVDASPLFLAGVRCSIPHAISVRCLESASFWCGGVDGSCIEVLEATAKLALVVWLPFSIGPALCGFCFRDDFFLPSPTFSLGVYSFCCGFGLLEGARVSEDSLGGEVDQGDVADDEDGNGLVPPGQSLVGELFSSFCGWSSQWKAFMARVSGHVVGAGATKDLVGVEGFVGYVAVNGVLF
ncbi:hypothetical protein SUGI_0040310 [Cryptomeria japonica]|nr:hypothetical protein SUGI_0040310 [Cryptomeria japonica]